MKRDFERFYRENIDRIYRYVFFRVGSNRELAEDLVSEIFLKAFNAFHSYDPSVSRSAWIYRIAHNHLANYFRDRKQEVDLDGIVLTAVGERGEETMLRQEAARTVATALQQLDKDDRRLVTMKYLEGYGYEDMAAIVGKSAGTLKVATHRAVKRLKESIIKFQEGRNSKLQN